MDNEISFGIGCFHFGLTRCPPFTITLHDYLKTVRAGLESISNIDSLETEAFDEDQELSIAGEEVPKLSDGYGPFPHPGGLRLQFDVYLPFRVQAELTEPWIPESTCSERFRLHFLYTYHGPVCFVQILHPIDRPAPSQAVRVVREFLRRELARIENGIALEVLGPSPFHADCYLAVEMTQENEQGPNLGVGIAQRRGYDEVNITVHSSNPNEEDPFLQAIEDIADELGLYYAIQSYQTRLDCTP